MKTLAATILAAVACSSAIAKPSKDSVYLETYTETFVFDNCSKTGANDIVLASYCEDRGEDANTIFSGPLNSPPISIIIVMPEDQFVFYNNDCYIVSNEPKKGGGVNYFVACDAP